MEATRGQAIRNAAGALKAGNTTIEHVATEWGVTAEEVRNYQDGGEEWLVPQLPASQPERRERGPLKG
jgi:hypothetical protein